MACLKWKVVLLCMYINLLLNLVNCEPKGGRGGGGGGGGRGGGGKAGAVAAGVGVGVAAGVVGAVAVHELTEPHYYSQPVLMAAPIPAPVIPTYVQESPVPTATPAAPGAAPAAPSTSPQLGLNIYYEAMDAISQFFFNIVFIKTFGSFSSLVDVVFIPCQQATDTNGDLTCPSKVDPSCSLDKIHSCAIAQTTDKIQLINFLVCTMTSVEKLPDYMTCATQNKMDSQKLQTCATSDEGKNLCKSYIEKKLPNCSTMPGFVFRKPNDDQAITKFEHLDNFISSVCTTDLQAAFCAQLQVVKATGMPQECNQRLLVGIFYKAMDEKSQKWFQSFAAIYEKLSNSLIVKYAPCMFAELSSDGNLDCKDQADTGCVAAKTHACAVSTIADPKLLFQFLSCTMKDATKMPDFEKCATDYKIPYAPIKTCAESDLGKQLCFEFSKTRPKTDKIPAFSYDMTFDDATSEETSTATNLQTTICQQMAKYGIAPPPDCAATGR